ncbi:hypothetical protein ACM66B_006198 [Microbotryomycetes sp. NB124-2]
MLRLAVVLLSLALVLQATTVLGAVFSCVGGSVYIVAHADDDLLFQSPDLLTDVRNNQCSTLIVLTAGDSGSGTAYAQGREAGNEAAYAQMKSVTDSYTEFKATFAGNAVLVRTLKAAPQIQKVYFRLPDGNMDGSGYAVTGYQSLRSLYFGNIGSITAQDGSATWTLSSLKAALGEIVTARQPKVVRTLDHLSDYDAGDHADHITTGRLSAEIQAQFAPSASFSGYMGYPISNLAPTLKTSSADFLAKSAAMFAYAPYDNAMCQSYSLCSSAGRGEAYWLLRQYVVTPALATTSTVGSADKPPVLPVGGTNIAPLASVSASTSYPGSLPFAAIDGNIGGYPGNDSAEFDFGVSTPGATFTLTWNAIYNVTSVVLYDRPNLNDWIQAGTLTFSDGSRTSFGSLYNDGSATSINLPAPVLTNSIVLTIDAVASSTSQYGLSEIQVYGVQSSSNSTSGGSGNSTVVYSTINVAPFAVASANGESPDTEQTADKAIDTFIDGYKEDGTGVYQEEWASGMGVGAQLTLNWNTTVSIAQIVLYDRPNYADQITGATIEFSTGRTINVGALQNDGTATYINLATQVNATSLVLRVTSVSPTTTSAGLAEIQVFGLSGTNTNLFSSTQPTATSAAPVPTGTAVNGVNLARWAVISASSQNDATGQTADKATDGVIDGYKEDGSGNYTYEWASDAGDGTTLTLAWANAITIGTIIFYDRPNLNDWIIGGTISFGDGSSLNVGSLVNDGRATVVRLSSPVTTSSLVFTITSVSDTTTSAGLAEIEVFAPGYNASPTSDSSVPTPTPSLSTQTNIAPLAVASASAEQPATLQTADKAIDGYVDGYDYQGQQGMWWEEWASGTGVGTTLTLTWPASATFSTIVLYDRPNLNDQITSGTLTFDDGTSVSFGQLFNDASPTYVFLPSIVTSTTLTLTVTGVSSSTTSVGLAEIEVYGSLSTIASAAGSASVPVSTSVSTALVSSASVLPGFSSSSPTTSASSFAGVSSVALSSGSASASQSSLPSSRQPVSTALSSGASFGSISASGSGIYSNATLASSTVSSSSRSSAVPTALSSSFSASSQPSSAASSFDSASTASQASVASASAASVASAASQASASQASASRASASRASASQASASQASASQASASLASASQANASQASASQASASQASASQASASQASVSRASQSAVSASQASASAASASQASASLASASAASASIASASQASVSRASASMASASQASASQASASQASASQASASQASASQASASQASASLASASAAAASQASASMASASQASASLASASASAASVASASSASAASVASASSASAASVASASSASVLSASLASVSRASASAASASSKPSPPPGPSPPSPTGPAATPTVTAASNSNIAPMASATASSWRASSPPRGINDNRVGGINALGQGDASQEWSTGNSAVPAWVQLTWPSFYVMKSVYLYAPENSLSKIRRGYLTFSDGSRIDVTQQLSQSGTAISLGPAGKVSTSVRFTITDMGFSLGAAGLAEIKVFNAPVVSCSWWDVLCLLGI